MVRLVMFNVEGMVQIAGKREQDEHKRAGVEMLILILSGLLSHLSHSFCYGRSFS